MRQTEVMLEQWAAHFAASARRARSAATTVTMQSNREATPICMVVTSQERDTFVHARVDGKR